MNMNLQHILATAQWAIRMRAYDRAFECLGEYFLQRRSGMDEPFDSADDAAVRARESAVLGQHYPYEVS